MGNFFQLAGWVAQADVVFNSCLRVDSESFLGIFVGLRLFIVNR
jgi:hypothetical protein